MPKVGKKHYPYTHAGRRAAKEAAKKKGLKVEYTENTYERIAKLMFEGTNKEKTRRRVKIKHIKKYSERADQAYDDAEKDYTKSGDDSVARGEVRNPSIQTRDAMRITQDIAQKAARELHRARTGKG